MTLLCPRGPSSRSSAEVRAARCGYAGGLLGERGRRMQDRVLLQLPRDERPPRFVSSAEITLRTLTQGNRTGGAARLPNLDPNALRPLSSVVASSHKSAPRATTRGGAVRGIAP